MNLDVLIGEEGVAFEEALLKDPEIEDLWLDYVQANEGHFERSAFILERAVSSLPASQSLWNAYLQLPWRAEDSERLEALYGRALQILHDTPALWLQYLKMMKNKGNVHEYSQALDRALFNLHYTHHKAIWQEYLELADSERGDLGVSVYTRLFEVQDSEDCPISIDKCECVLKIAQFGDIDCALTLLQKVPRNQVRVHEKKSLTLSIILDILISSNEFTNASQFERLVLDAALDIPDRQSKYLLKAASFFKKMLDRNKARYYYCRALELATSMKSLAFAFEEYTNFLEEELEDLNDKHSADELELRIDFLRQIIEKQPIFANDLLLKTEPDNIDLWLDRVNIYRAKNMTSEVIVTLISAIKSINPLGAFSRENNTLAKIWSEYANLYTSLGDTKTAQFIYSRAVKSQYKSADELAEIYIMWCELVLLDSDEKAFNLIELILLVTPRNSDEIKVNASNLSVQERVFKSTHLWAFYIDLIRSMGDEEQYVRKLKTAYETMMRLKVITLRMLFQYTDFLSEREELEACYSAYEAGIACFRSSTPLFQIWESYLRRLIANEKHEKVIDTFERCLLSHIPGHLVTGIFDMYSSYIKRSGSLAKSIKCQLRAIEYLTAAYSQTTNTENLNKIVDDKFQIYHRLLTALISDLKDTELFRNTMVSAIKDTQLSLSMVVELSQVLARFELSSGEISRARALYKHAASLAHPDSRVLSLIWAEWTQFEVDNGSESTYKDMLLFKRLVGKEYEAIDDYKSELNPMGFVRAEMIQKDDVGLGPTVAQDPNAIEIDMDM